MNYENNLKMNKAKAILVAIVILAALGGTIAFKAQRSVDKIYGGEVGELPTTTLTGYKVTVVGVGWTTGATTAPTAMCIRTWITVGL